MKTIQKCDNNIYSEQMKIGMYFCLMKQNNIHLKIALRLTRV